MTANSPRLSSNTAETRNINEKVSSVSMGHLAGTLPATETGYHHLCRCIDHRTHDVAIENNMRRGRNFHWSGKGGQALEGYASNFYAGDGVYRPGPREIKKLQNSCKGY